MNVTVALPLAASLNLGCSKAATDAAVAGSTVSAAAPSTVIGAIDSKVADAGSGLAVGVSAFAVDDECDVHSSPISSGSQMASSDPIYPLKYFYCKIMKNTGDPESVRGSYTLLKSISCALESAGALVYDGTTRSVTMTISSPCFTAQQISNMGAGSMSVSVTATSPAAFNTYYSNGVVVDVTGFGTFKFATRVSGSVSEFMAGEDQTAVSANKTGAYAASYDSSTGVLRFEARHDRFACSETGSCGWSRHQRIYADLALSASGEVIGVDDISATASEIYSAAMGGGTASGTALSLQGNTTTGLRGRGFNVSSSTQAYLKDSARYSESTAVNNCFNNSGSSGTGCPAGIVLPTSNSIAFTQYSGTGYTTPMAWMTGLTSGLAFSSANFTDVQ